MSGSRSRRKGKRGEYIVRDLLRKWGFEARRGVASAGEPDEVHDIPGYHIEVKNVEALNIWAALGQAERDATNGDESILFFKRNQSKVYAAIDAEHLLQLLRLKSTYNEFKEINDRLPF